MKTRKGLLSGVGISALVLAAPGAHAAEGGGGQGGGGNASRRPEQAPLPLSNQVVGKSDIKLARKPKRSSGDDGGGNGTSTIPPFSNKAVGKSNIKLAKKSKRDSDGGGNGTSTIPPFSNKAVGKSNIKLAKKSKRDSDGGGNGTQLANSAIQFVSFSISSLSELFGTRNRQVRDSAKDGTGGGGGSGGGGNGSNSNND